MRVVIDTNVLVSAAITGRNPEVVILFVVASLDWEWVVSAEILTEYKEVLNRSRLKLTESQKQRWFNIFDAATTLISLPDNQTRQEEAPASASCKKVCRLGYNTKSGLTTPFILKRQGGREQGAGEQGSFLERKQKQKGGNRSGFGIIKLKDNQGLIKMLPLQKISETKKAQIVSIIIEANEDGYLASIPGIQGAFAEGDTPQEAIFNCIDVLSMIIDYRKVPSRRT